MNVSDYFKHLSLLLLLFVIAGGGGNELFAQNTKVQVSGRVLDAKSQQPLPYATVVAKADSNTVLGGATTGEDGAFEFSVKAESFFVEVRFMGYQTQQLNTFDIDRGKVNLGDILLEETGSMMDEVEITATKSTTEFRLDKRIFNVGQDLSSSGMGALEVLNNVPL